MKLILPSKSRVLCITVRASFIKLTCGLVGRPGGSAFLSVVDWRVPCSFTVASNKLMSFDTLPNPGNGMVVIESHLAEPAILCKADGRQVWVGLIPHISWLLCYHRSAFANYFRQRLESHHHLNLSGECFANRERARQHLLENIQFVSALC